MLAKKIVISLVLVSSLLGFPTKDYADEIKINPQDLSVTDQVIYFSNLYGGDSEIALKVMDCESGGNHSVVGDGGRSRGIFQFQKSTFERMERGLGENLNYTSQFDQIKLASYALSHDELAREWSTYRAIKNGGKYAFYSSQLKRHFVVYCRI